MALDLEADAAERRRFARPFAQHEWVHLEMFVGINRAAANIVSRNKAMMLFLYDVGLLRCVGPDATPFTYVGVIAAVPGMRGFLGQPPPARQTGASRLAEHLGWVKPKAQAQAQAPCPECRGSRVYVGLCVVEPCSRCGGKP